MRCWRSDWSARHCRRPSLHGRRDGRRTLRCWRSDWSTRYRRRLTSRGRWRVRCSLRCWRSDWPTRYRRRLSLHGRWDRRRTLRRWRSDWSTRHCRRLSLHGRQDGRRTLRCWRSGNCFLLRRCWGHRWRLHDRASRGLLRCTAGFWFWFWLLCLCQHCPPMAGERGLSTDVALDPGLDRLKPPDGRKHSACRE